jgi:hypothetical protein
MKKQDQSSKGWFATTKKFAPPAARCSRCQMPPVPRERAGRLLLPQTQVSLQLRRIARSAKAAIALSLVLAVGLVAGCGLTKSYVQIVYHPTSIVPIVRGAEAVKVKVAVVDRLLCRINQNCRFFLTTL